MIDLIFFFFFFIAAVIYLHSETEAEKYITFFQLWSFSTLNRRTKPNFIVTDF